MKKRLVLIAVSCVFLVMAACGKKKTEPAEETKVQETAVESVAVTDTETENAETTENPVDALGDIGQQLNGLLDMYNNSSWSGVDAEGNLYVLTLENGQFAYHVSGSEGESVMQGSYQVDPEGIRLMAEDSQENIKKFLDDSNCEYSFDSDNPYLKVNDVYLTRDTVTDYQEKLQELDLASIAAEYMNRGHSWIACTDDKAVVLFFIGQALAMRYIYYNGVDFDIQNIDADWGMNAKDLFLYNAEGKTLDDIQWNFQEEEDLRVFTITDSDETLIFYELESDSLEEGQEKAKAFLMNRKDIEDIEDLTTVLAGYEGVSIVDAFVMAGLDPSLSNRAVYAEKFEIEHYRGTAEQNLFLLESMGGKIK